MAAAQDDAIPILVHFGRGVTQVGDRAVLNPSAAAIDAGRVAAFAVKGDVKFFALANGFFADFLIGRLRHGRNFNVRSRKWKLAAEFESVQTFGAALGFGCGHGAGGSEEARTGTPAHGSNHVL